MPTSGPARGPASGPARRPLSSSRRRQFGSHREIDKQVGSTRNHRMVFQEEGASVKHERVVAMTGWSLNVTKQVDDFKQLVLARRAHAASATSTQCMGRSACRVLPSFGLSF